MKKLNHQHQQSDALNISLVSGFTSSELNDGLNEEAKPTLLDLSMIDRDDDELFTLKKIKDMSDLLTATPSTQPSTTWLTVKKDILFSTLCKAPLEDIVKAYLTLH